MIADSLGRPPLSGTESLPLIETLRTRAHELNLRQNPPRPILLGRHLIHLGHTPGPQFSAILHAGFEAQLDGAFSDAEGALIWLRNYLQKIPHPES
jgi:tRNA nucleotidyltransferase (CCA-adding enzyme)